MAEVKTIHSFRARKAPRRGTYAHEVDNVKMKFVDWANLLTNDSMGLDSWLERERNAVAAKEASLALAISDREKSAETAL